MVDIPVPARSPLDHTRDSAWRVRARRGWELTCNVLAHPTTVIGVIIIVLMIGIALLAPVITQPNTPDPYQLPRAWGAPPPPPATPGPLLGTHTHRRDAPPPALR